jgi:hypothetical protein
LYTKFFFLDSEKKFSDEIIFIVDEIAPPTVAKDIIEDFFMHFDKKNKKSKSFSMQSSNLLTGKLCKNLVYKKNCFLKLFSHIYR